MADVIAIVLADEVWFPNRAVRVVGSWAHRELAHHPNGRVVMCNDGTRFRPSFKFGVELRPRLLDYRRAVAFVPNPCMTCGLAHYTQFWPGACTTFIGSCLVCEGWSESVMRRPKERICRPCRRYIKHKEKELWLRRIHLRADRRAWRRGESYLRQVRKLLNPEPLKSHAGESELVLTSRTL